MLWVSGEKEHYIGRLAEHLVLSDLPLRGRTAELKAVDQIQSVVVCVDRDEVSVKLMHLLHTAALVRTSQLLKIVLTADIRKV